MDNQIGSPFDSGFADNPEPRCPLVLLLDTSGSMSGAPIQELNNGLFALKDELLNDQVASKRVEIAVVTFGPVQIQSDFQTVDQFHPPQLEANSDTPMGQAIQQGLDLVAQRKDIYKQAGIAYYRPWVFLITDGAPTDEWQTAASLVKAGEQNGSFTFFAVGVGGANLDILGQISVRPPQQLKGLMFRELFQWLSASMKSVSHSRPGDRTRLPKPTWDEV